MSGALHETQVFTLTADQMEDLYRRAEGNVGRLEDLIMQLLQVEMDVANEKIRLQALSYEDVRNEFERVWRDMHVRTNLICPICRASGHWRRSDAGE